MKLKQLSKRLLYSALIAFLSISLSFIIFYISMKHQFNLEQRRSQLNEIQNILNLYKSHLSEKLSILGNSSEFIDYLNSGVITRHEKYIHIATLLARFSSPEISGITVQTIKKNPIFSYGKRSHERITLKLCYINQIINGDFGNCNYLISIFINKELFIKTLQKINPAISQCTHCQKTNISDGNNFGSFNLYESAPILFGLKILSTHYDIDQIIFLFSLISLISMGLLTLIIHRVINNNLYNPLINIINELDQGRLYQNHFNIQEFNILIEKIKSFFISEKKAEIAQIAAQAAHDIRSPLATLEISVTTLAGIIPEFQQSLLKESVHSIRTIAQQLLEKYRNTGPNNQTLLDQILTKLIIAKKQEWLKYPCQLDLQVEKNARHIFIPAEETVIQRMLSNLLNNAYESLSKHRCIFVSLTRSEDQLHMTVSDTGCGIDTKHLNLVLQGVSFKHSGSGLGLSNAKQIMETIGGELKITSVLHEGTQIKLIFPISGKHLSNTEINHE